MQHDVMSNDKPQAVELFTDIGGTRFARLRKNIREVWVDAPEEDLEPTCIWKYDEIVVRTDLSQEEIEEKFAQLWYETARANMSDAEWRADVDSILLDLMEMAVS